MLVLTRKIGEGIVIDNRVTLVVLAVQGDKVRLGVEAPPEVRVDREEIHQRRQVDAQLPLTTEKEILA